jgi:hypothetical protein
MMISDADKIIALLKSFDILEVFEKLSHGSPTPNKSKPTPNCGRLSKPTVRIPLHCDHSFRWKLSTDSAAL